MYVALFNHTHCQNKVTKVVLNMSDGEKCSLRAVCYLIMTESCCDLTLTQQDSGITRWQTDEEEHFSPFDTFKTRSQLEEHFSILFVLFFISLPPCFDNIALLQLSANLFRQRLELKSALLHTVDHLLTESCCVTVWRWQLLIFTRQPLCCDSGWRYLSNSDVITASWLTGGKK